MNQILVLHGPNLNMLGQREPEVYGSLSLEELDQRLTHYGAQIGLKVSTDQSNLEGELINRLHQSVEYAAGVLFNPGGYTHTSVALRDAITAISVPVIEVHISNVYAREDFRHKSLIAPVCTGKITGFGWHSYLLGLQAFSLMLKMNQE